MATIIAIKLDMYASLGDPRSLKTPMMLIPRTLKSNVKILCRLITVALSLLGDILIHPCAYSWA
ncbi:MAG: hypothetical protein J7L11_11050 [Thermoprotei archaeon]|nr:hypothetical protein [Thermoprotei archaeon]